MVSEWRYTTYGKVAQHFGKRELKYLCIEKIGIQTGPFGSQLHKDDYVANGTPIITVEHLAGNRISHENLPMVSDKDKERLSRYHLQSGDIVFSRVGSVDRNALVRSAEDGWLFSGRCLRVRVDQSRLWPKYLAYFLSHCGVKEHIRSIAVGATMPSINTKILSNLDIYYPPLPEQKAIAHILGSLDDKIELNKRMNATLEGMAQALFKSWFVDFDPVIDNAIVAGNPIPKELSERAAIRRKALADDSANRETAKNFPSSFRFNEEMGWISEGWEVRSLDFLAKLDTTSVKPFKQPETLWEHYSIPAFDSSRMPVLEKGSNIKSNKYLVKPKAVLSSKLNPETERTWWPFILDENTSICSTEFMQFVPLIEKEQAFVYSLIRSKPFQANILERVTGSTGSRQRAQPKQIAKIDVADCGELLRRQFVKVALPLFQSIRNNLIQSRYLSNLRDTLLPKLISGELRVSNAEKLVEEEL